MVNVKPGWIPAKRGAKSRLKRLGVPYLAHGRIRRVCEERGAEMVLRLVLEGADGPEARQALEAATDEAVDRDVFGAPAFFVGGEIFWGNDRLHIVEAAL